MNKQTYLTTARLSAAGMLALMITACGSSDSSGTTTPASSVAASSAIPASSVAASSTGTVVSSAANSSVAPAAIAESCNVADGTYSECLDFEGMAPGATPDGFNLSGSGIAVVEGEGSHSGSLALKVSGAGASYLSLADFTGTHWGRMYYKNTAKPSTIDAYSHTTLIAGFDGGAEFRFVDMVAAPDDAGDAGKYQHLYNTEPNDLSLEGPYSNSYDGEWVCVEWSMDTAAQEFHLYQDGTEVGLANFGTASNSTNLADAKKYNFATTNKTYQMTPVPTMIPELRIGIQNYQGHNYTFLLDDIAISATERVGCEIVEEASSSSQMSSSSSMMSSSEMSSSSMMSSEAASSSAPAVVVGKADYDAMCVGCHTNAASISGGRDQAALAAYISASMPVGNAGACMGACAEDTAAYILK